MAAIDLVRDAQTFMIAGGIGGLIGLILWWMAYRKDRSNWIVEKAPPLPIKLVNVQDDVWVSGDTRCESSLQIPHFGHNAVYYDYRLEEKVTRRVGKRTTTSWVTRDHHTKSIPFRINDKGDELWIFPENAELEGLPSTGYDYEGGFLVSNWRHSATYLPHPARVSAIGSVSEKRESLQPYQNIPLIVTLKSRKEYLQSLESGETSLRVFGFILLLLGLCSLLAGAVHINGWMGTDDEGLTKRLIMAGGAALVVFFLFWVWVTYNRIVMYRIRVDAAWRQIDVDLKQRHDLVPNLVATIKGYMKHESTVFTELARLRNLAAQADRRQTVAMEPEIVRQVRSLAAVVEQYPDLKSNELVLRLQEQLTAIEDKIAHGREFFNEAVMEYNTFVQQFPTSVIFRRPALSMFAAIGDERDAQRVEL